MKRLFGNQINILPTSILYFLYLYCFKMGHCLNCTFIDNKILNISIYYISTNIITDHRDNRTYKNVRANS